ncbi:ABC transporter permease subunit [Streptacidiphilus sp. N1-3]|uniref:ABC transporter permease subunit n=1 Tax=Streptacidiphilus alkalitolerans TaxID=3342712 RepID=A0ABV6X324_9ACTN
MSGTVTPYRSARQAGRDGFARLLRAEWTKFRTVPGWMLGLAVAVLATVLVSLLGVLGGHASCGGGPGGGTCTGPVGPGGEAVTDSFTFVNRPLTGDGGITVRLASLTGARSGVEPWAKAGIIVKDGDSQGSAYAAVMATGAHGVRMQDDFTHDTAGPPGAVSADSPRWLRLTRSGDTLTGFASADGTHWSTVGTAHLKGLPTTVRAGLFVTSPDHLDVTDRIGGAAATGGPTRATGVFDQVGLSGNWPQAAWSGTSVGDRGPMTASLGGFTQSGDSFTVNGSGDIAPAVDSGGGQTLERRLIGTFAGLIVVIVVATLFITAEYRRGLIRTTLTASPRRVRVLAAKAVVIGSVTFAAGLVAAVAAVVIGGQVLRSEGVYVYPVSTLTELRVVVGTAGLLAVTAVLALALGTVLRRSAGAVTAVVVAIVLPYILAMASVLPTGPADWLLRVTPAAAFAVQQSLPQYAQVSNPYTPPNGYFPLAPWAGFGVLCGYAVLALALAAHLLRRRDV